MIIDLEKKAWYRAIKVLYFFAFILSLLFIGSIAFSYKPHSFLDKNNYKVTCNNGKEYKTSELSLSDSYGSDFNLLCRYGKNIPQGQLLEVPSTDNYTLTYELKTISSWSKVGLILLVGLVIVVLLFFLIRIVFLYIVTGKVH